MMDSYKDRFLLNPIETKKEGTDTALRSSKTTRMEAWEASTSNEPLSPAARLFHTPRFNCHIIAVMGCKTSLNPDAIKMGLEHTLIKHPRFSSKLVIDDKGRIRKWERVTVYVEDHITVPSLDTITESPDQFVEDYIAHLTTIPLDFSKPLWEMHLLNVKTSDAECVAVLKIHHSMGDGASLISLLLACTRKASDPDQLPSIPLQQRAATTSSGFWWVFLAVWTVLRMLWYTIVDLIFFAATVLFLRDTETCLKGEAGVELKPKRLVYRTVSLDDIKLVKNAMNMTINDVILGITQAGLSRYLNRKYGEDYRKNGGTELKKSHLPKSIRVRSTVLINLRPTAGIQTLADLMANGFSAKWGWGNWIGYIILPFKIAVQDDPLDYICDAKSTIDRKKQSFEAILSYTCALLVLRIFGVKATAAVANRTLLNTTFSFSNVVGPLEEISFYGHPIAYIAPSVYGHPQALTMHFQSYCDKMTVVVAVDPDIIPDPHQLCEDLDESLKVFKDAVVKRGQVAVV